MDNKGREDSKINGEEYTALTSDNVFSDRTSNISLTSSMVDRMFCDVQGEQEKLKDDSSLSVLDLDALDDDNFFVIGSDAPSTPAPSSHIDHHLLDASPIPLQAEVGLRVPSTPALNPKVSSFESGEGFQGRPFSCSSVSSISCDAIVASTPFLRRTMPFPKTAPVHDGVDEMTSTVANRTYNLNDHEQRTAASHPLDATYDGNRRIDNATFTSAPVPINDATFNKTSCDLPTATRADQTFEIAVDRIPEKGPVSSPRLARSAEQEEMDVVAAEVVVRPPFTAPAEDEIVQRQKVEGKRETQKSGLRTPLTALNVAATNHRLKTPATSLNNKRLSRLQAPKPHAGRRSVLPVQSSKLADVRDENATAQNKSGDQSVKKKPVASVSRRSMLPPPSGKLCISQTPAKSIDVSRSSSSGILSRTKRKKVSQNNSNVSKVSSAAPKSLAPSLLSRRFADTSMSHVTSSSSRSSTKLQKPEVSTRQSRTATSSSTETSQKKGSIRQSCKSNFKAKSTNRVSSTSSPQCAVAMAILLDYVVNKIDGLSAPQLSKAKQRLSAKLAEKTQNFDVLDSRAKRLQTELDQLREAYEARDRDAAAEATRHNKEVDKLKEGQARALKELSEEVVAFKSLISQQKEERDSIVKFLNEERNHKIEALSSKYENDIAQLRRQWSDEREEIARETLDLQERMEDTIESKTQELVKPYVDSFRENKSLRDVIEMKNNEHHKLLVELSQRGEKMNEARSLQDHVTALQQRNEDLETRFDARTAEYRAIQMETIDLRRHLAEQENLNQQLLQRVEELTYRLENGSQSPCSPFNPIFTQSRTKGRDVAGSFSHPVDSSLLTSGDVFSSMESDVKCTSP